MDIVRYEETDAPLARGRENEIEAQLSAAHRYPREPATALKRAKTMAVASPEVAAACGYALSRGDKLIAGPSVRLAEMMASVWGNLRVAAQVMEIDEKSVIARGVVWDLESNVQASVDIRRGIVDRYGRRFSEDMIGVTCNAACAIARRNAIMQVVPRAYIEDVYKTAMAVATASDKPIAERRQNAIKAFTRWGVSATQILARLGLQAIEQLDDEHLETLTGLRASIKAGEMTAKEAFAPVVELEPAASAADIVAKKARKKHTGEDLSLGALREILFGTNKEDPEMAIFWHALTLSGEWNLLPDDEKRKFLDDARCASVAARARDPLPREEE